MIQRTRTHPALCFCSVAPLLWAAGCSDREPGHRTEQGQESSVGTRHVGSIQPQRQ